MIKIGGKRRAYGLGAPIPYIRSGFNKAGDNLHT